MIDPDDLAKCVANTQELIATCDLNDYAMTEEDERDHWSGVGHLEFYVIQNVPDCFEVEIIDYSGCMGGADETLGIHHLLEDCWGFHEDPDIRLREGCRYTVHDIEVDWTMGDGWTTDDDVEYYPGAITEAWTIRERVSQKLSNWWHRQVRCRVRGWRHGR